MGERQLGNRDRRARWAGIVGFVAIVAGILGPAPVAAAPIGVDPDGSWASLEDWPLIALHGVLTADGEVVTYGTRGDGTQTGFFEYDVWDSSGAADEGHLTLPNTTGTDIFCSIQLLRPNGTVALFGGDNWTGSGTTNTGNPDINIYDPDADTLTTIDPLVQPRWYASSITLGDGSVYVQGGDGYDIDWNPGPPTAELWTEEAGAVELPFDTSTLSYWYPRNFVLSDGRIFGVDVGGRMYYISADLQTLTQVGRLASDYRGNGSTAVMYEPGMVLLFGASSDKAIIIDANGATPALTPTDSLSSRREWVNSTLLPDGRVLATGGSEVKNQLEGVNRMAEIWDPATGLWTTGAEGVRSRLYHSIALLLPDGRVLVAGGGAPGPEKNTNAEIYSPDYLVAADGSAMPRPSITSLSTSTAQVGEPVVVGVDDASDIERVTLLKTGSVTHSFNVEQRILNPSFSVSGNELSFDMPTNSNDLTPGHWLLTVIDEDGIPSASEIISVPPPPLPVIAPGAAQVAETDTGSTVLTLPVTLDRIYHQDVTVDWATVDVPSNPSIASSTAGDYVATSGTLTFPAGTTNGTFDVTVLGDDIDEVNEWLLVYTSNPTNAIIGGYFGLGFGLLLDNDEPPVVLPGTASIDENAVPATVSIPISLSAPSGKTITVDWATIDHSTNPNVASATDGDFLADSGTVTFAPGSIQEFVEVTILDDATDELDEWLGVSTSNPTNATIGGWFGVGLALILDDDL